MTPNTEQTSERETPTDAFHRLYVQLLTTKDPIEAFNLFLEIYLPEDYAHFIDSDDNGAEFVRRVIREHIEQAKVSERKKVSDAIRRQRPL